MKKQSISILRLLICSSLFFLTASAASAQSATQDSAVSPVTVKFLGTQDDMVVFNVSYDNPSGNKFMVVVKDQEGGTLYNNMYSKKTFYKQFRLPKTDGNKITFIIRNFRDADIARTFEVNVNSRMIEEVAIRKMD